MASYFLSRTLVPTMMHFLLENELKLYQDPKASEEEKDKNFVWRWHSRFDEWFERRRDTYHRALVWTLDNRGLTLAVAGIFILLTLPLLFFIGRDFFPYVDSGQMSLHVYPPQGMRPEDSEQYFAAVEREIKHVIPSDELSLILDNIGLPNGGFNLAFSSDNATSNSDGSIQITLKPGPRHTQLYMRELRQDLHKKFPDGLFFFTPANITNQILDFGLPAPIDLQVVAEARTTIRLPWSFCRKCKPFLASLMHIFIRKSRFRQWL